MKEWSLQLIMIDDSQKLEVSKNKSYKLCIKLVDFTYYLLKIPQKPNFGVSLNEMILKFVDFKTQNLEDFGKFVITTLLVKRFFPFL